MWAGRLAINILPDDVLLHIFFFDGLVYQHQSPSATIHFLGRDLAGRLLHLPWKWYRLAHVCMRWRSIIFASPNFLDLRLVCLPGTRLELTGIWPPLPIIITNAVYNGRQLKDFNPDVAIVHPTRVREINLLGISRSQLQRLVTRMEEQFPALLRLVLSYKVHRYDVPALPDGFLGGSASRLQYFGLCRIPFPALPKFLLSATDLVELILTEIPHSGYISPEAFVTGLAVMANLNSVVIEFHSPLSRPDRTRRRPPPPIRTILPALTHFEFRGVSEYLEDLVARIDAPLLNSMGMIFFHQLIFDNPQLAQFMGRTTIFHAVNEAHVSLDDSGVCVRYSPPTWIAERYTLKISCRELDWQLSALAQVLTSFSPSISTAEHLYMYGTPTSPQWREDIENMQWLEIFEPFTAVKNLYLTKAFAPHIARTLQELVESRMPEVLPALQNIFLEGYDPSGPIPEGIGKFVAARQLSGHSIAVSYLLKFGS